MCQLVLGWWLDGLFSGTAATAKAEILCNNVSLTRLCNAHFSFGILQPLAASQDRWSRAQWLETSGLLQRALPSPPWGPCVTVWASASTQASVTHPGEWSRPCDKEELNRNVIFPIVNSAPIYCPTSSPLTPAFQENRDSLSDKVFSLPTWKGYGAIASLLKSRCLWR